MSRPSRADLAGVTLGDASPVAVMGVINVSPESFHAGSVNHGDEAVLKAALGMVEAGAALIDVGARSSGPYIKTGISEGEETERLVRAVGMLAAKLPVPVSADTSRPAVARAALQAGARVVNDVSALAEPALARVVAEHDAGLVVGASAARPAPAEGGPSEMGRVEAPILTVRGILERALAAARTAGVPEERIVLDPGIGFFRGTGVPCHLWAVVVAASLAARQLELHSLGWLLDTLWSFWVVVLVVLFQPELRRALTSIGHAPALRALLGSGGVETLRVVDEIASVAGSLAERRIGALIVIERGTGLRQYAELGVALDALVSADLLTSLFLPYSPLHDGAAFIRDERVIAAGCFLPLSRNLQLARQLGTRHRAALGVTEETDAVAVVVSEETGRLSLAVDGGIEALSGPDALGGRAAGANRCPCARRPLARAGGRQHAAALRG